MPNPNPNPNPIPNPNANPNPNPNPIPNAIPNPNPNPNYAGLSLWRPFAMAGRYRFDFSYDFSVVVLFCSFFC